MKLKDDKRRLIIKGKEGKDYRVTLNPNNSYNVVSFSINFLYVRWGLRGHSSVT